MAKFVVEQEIFDYIFGWWWLQERIEGAVDGGSLEGLEGSVE